MTHHTTRFGVTPQEAAFIRSQLNLRYNQEQGCWEVFTTIHGSGGLFKWILVRESAVIWYATTFQTIATRMDMTSRGLLEDLLSVGSAA